MKHLSTYNLSRELGPRFSNSFIELYSYDGSLEEDRIQVSKAIKTLMPEDKHGVTSFEEWGIMSRPTIKIFVDINDNLYRAFITVPHEISHAVGTGVLLRAAEFKMREIYPGCEELALLTGAITCRFQSAYMKETGLVVKETKNES